MRQESDPQEAMPERRADGTPRRDRGQRTLQLPEPTHHRQGRRPTVNRVARDAKRVTLPAAAEREANGVATL